MTKHFNREYGAVYVGCLETARALEFEITTEEIDSGIIDFKVGMSLWSFGEKFRITINAVEPQLIEVTVGSQTAVQVQLIAWGKNKRNIENFFDLLTERLSK